MFCDTSGFNRVLPCHIMAVRKPPSRASVRLTGDNSFKGLGLVENMLRRWWPLLLK